MGRKPRGGFCYLKHFCKHCGKPITLDPKQLVPLKFPPSELFNILIKVK